MSTRYIVTKRLYTRFVLEHVRSRDGAQDQEIAPMSPDSFPRDRMRGGVWERD